MTKEQLYVIWTLLPELKADIDAVIAYEIAKAKGVEKPALNPIEQAYEQWLKVRPKKWDKGHWIKKYDNLHWIHSNGVMQVKIISLFENPHDWELYTEAEAEQVTDQPAPPMTYKEAVNLIILNRLTHKWAGNDSWFACAYCGKIIQFCDENGQDMIEVKFDELDLTEWYPYTKPFDQDRFERLFRAVVIASPHDTYDRCMEITNGVIKQLDDFYATKKGGNNE
jgi:hypothetical protein